MAKIIDDYLSPITTQVTELRKYLSNRALITDLVAKLVITFGVVLLVGGLYLMLTQPSIAAQSVQSGTAVETVVSTVNWIPGIPFYIGDLANLSSSIVGLVSWIVGLDLLLVGLGLWVRNRLAHFAALAIFALSAYFQFIQFIQWGIVGAPTAVVQLCADVFFLYFLFSKFDQKTNTAKQLMPKAASEQINILKN